MAQNCCNVQPCSLYIALKCFTTSKQQLLCVMLLTPPSILPHIQTEPESTRKQQSNNMLCMSNRGSEREVSLSIYYHFLNREVKVWMAEGNWTLRSFRGDQKLAETLSAQFTVLVFCFAGVLCSDASLILFVSAPFLLMVCFFINKQDCFT